MIRTQTREHRPGFTLVEIIVVISIILVLATLVAAVVSTPILVGDKARRGGDQVQLWLRVAKSRAMADGAPRGLRLIADPNSPDPTKPFVRELQYIEQPPDFIVMLPGNLAPFAPPQPRGITVTTQGVAMLDPNTGPADFTGGLGTDPADWPVHGDQIVTVMVNGQPQQVMSQPGDYLEVQGGGLLYRIVKVLSATQLVLDRAPTNPVNSPTAQYRIIRQPRPLMGETPLLLPQDVAIDSTWSWPAPSGAGSPDLLFAPSGRLMGPLGAQDQVILWVADVTRDRDPNTGAFTANSPVLVNIHPRTGFIAVHPVNVNDPTNPQKKVFGYVDSYWSFTKDGRLSGM